MSGPTLYRKGNLEATGYREKQKELDEIQPLKYIMDWFSDKLKSEPKTAADRILILQSSTGSGKSTVIPPELYHLFFESNYKNIGCTQPRILTSIDIPKTIVPFHTKEALRDKPGRKPLIIGENIGFQNSVITKKPQRGIIYMTVMTLTQQLNIMTEEDFMNYYSFIILDEAHERSMGTDLLIYLMKKFINRNCTNKNCPFFIIMSATFDTVKYCDYLLESVPKSIRYQNIIKVRGFSHPIEEHFLEYDSQDCIQSVIDKVIEIHTQYSTDFLPESGKLAKDSPKLTTFRDILIFVGGAGEIRKIKIKLEKLNSEHEFFKKHHIMPLELTGEMVSSQGFDYKAISKPMNELKVKGKTPTRRVIIGTNVAETGITIDTLGYVVETGWVHSKEFNPNFAVEILVRKPITQSMYKQRKGRVGRKAPGKSFAIYTKQTYEAMLNDQYPDIIKDEITLELLNLIIKEVDSESDANNLTLHELINKEFYNIIKDKKIDILKIDLLDMPSADSLHYSMEKLYVLGAIDANSIPTYSGIIINKIRMTNIECIRMILAGYVWDVSIIDLINLACFLQLDIDPINRKKKVNIYSSKIANYNNIKTEMLIDDFIEYLLIFNELTLEIEKSKLNKANKIVKEFCEELDINENVINEMIDKRESLIISFANLGMNPYKNIDKSLSFAMLTYSDFDKIEYISKIKQCIFEGFKLNLLQFNDYTKKYSTRKSSLDVNVDSMYTSDKSANPKYLIYNKIIYRYNMLNNSYDSVIDKVCILDGFVNLDLKYDILN